MRNVYMLLLLAGTVWGCGVVGSVERTPSFLTGQKAANLSGYVVRWTKPIAADPSVMVAVGTERSQPTFSADGSMLFVGSRQTGLHAFEVRTGRRIWSVMLNGGVVGQPAVDESLVVVGTGEGQLVGLSVSDGSVLWRNPLKGLAIRQPVILDQRVIARDGTNTVYAFNATNGAWLWQQAREKPAKFSMAGEGPLFAVSGTLYAGFSDGSVTAYDLNRDGKIAWTTQMGGESKRFLDIDTDFVFVRQYLGVASPATGLALLDTRNGKIASRIPRPNLITLKAMDRHLLATTTNGDVLRMDPERNVTLWRRNFSRDQGAPSALLVQGPNAFVSFPRGGLLALDAATGETLIGLDIGYGITGVAGHENTRAIAVLTTRGTLMVLGPQLGQPKSEATVIKALSHPTP